MLEERGHKRLFQETWVRRAVHHRCGGLLGDHALSHELSGASSIVVRWRDAAEVARVIAAMEGQLTATLILDEADRDLALQAANLLGIARRVDGQR